MCNSYIVTADMVYKILAVCALLLAVTWSRSVKREDYMDTLINNIITEKIEPCFDATDKKVDEDGCVTENELKLRIKEILGDMHDEEKHDNSIAEFAKYATTEGDSDNNECFDKAEFVALAEVFVIRDYVSYLLQEDGTTNPLTFEHFFVKRVFNF